MEISDTNGTRNLRTPPNKNILKSIAVSPNEPTVLTADNKTEKRITIVLKRDSLQLVELSNVNFNGITGNTNDEHIIDDIIEKIDNR